MGADKLNPNQFKFRYQLHEGVHNLDALDPETDINKGFMAWKEDTGEIEDILVPGYMRRQGVATSLWTRAHALAEERGITPPRHSERRTREGDAWAKKVGGEVPRRKTSVYRPGIIGQDIDVTKGEII